MDVRGITSVLGPKAEKCIRRPTCTDFDYYKSRAARCFSNATLQSTHVERVQPAVCKESTPSPSLIETTNEKCGSCRPGMERDPKTGVCKYCSVDEFSADGSGYYFINLENLCGRISCHMT